MSPKGGSGNPGVETPGVVRCHSPASPREYIGSPSLASLPKSEYVASHNHFGPGSSDVGRRCSHRWIAVRRGRNEQVCGLQLRIWINCDSTIERRRTGTRANRRIAIRDCWWMRDLRLCACALWWWIAAESGGVRKLRRGGRMGCEVQNISTGNVRLPEVAN